MIQMYFGKACKVDYYPCVLATVHGKTPDDYKACANYILELEKKYNYRFWGFALGGIASYKKLDKSWFDGISFKNLNKNDFAPLVGPAIASRIVRSLDKEIPIVITWRDRCSSSSSSIFRRSLVAYEYFQRSSLHYSSSLNSDLFLSLFLNYTRDLKLFLLIYCSKISLKKIIKKIYKK